MRVCLRSLPNLQFRINLASDRRPLFHLFRFWICIGYIAERALKLVVQGILLTSKAEKHPINSLLHMAPVAPPIQPTSILYIKV